MKLFSNHEFLRAPAYALASLALAAVSDIHAQLDVEIIAGPNIIVDSNVLSPSTYAPDTVTVQVEYCNNTGAAIDDIYAHIGNIDGGGTVATPGIYPVRDSDTDTAFQAESPHLANTGLYSYTHAAPVADSTRYLGTLAPGECATVYWMFCYPRVSNDGNEAVWGETRLESDDLWLALDAWASQINGGAIDPTNAIGEDTAVATMKNSISAMANKIGGPTGGVWTVTDANGDPVDPNTPAAPGELIKVCGTGFRLGVDNKGFDTDPDFAFDYGVWIQPVGDKSLFDPFCYRLVRTEGQLRISRSGGNPTYVYNFVDQTYFKDLPNDTNGGVGDVCYFLIAMSGPCSAALSPYQLVASGSENEKFNADFGTAVPQVVSGESTVELTKTVDLDNAAAGSLLTYDISITNPTGSDPLGLPQYGLQLALNEAIPSGTSYVAGSAEGVVGTETTANSITVGSGGFLDVLYSTDSGVSYGNSEPGDPTTVTHVRWLLDSPLQAAGTVFVQFQVAIDDPFGGPSPLIENTATLSFGDGPTFKEDDAGTLLSGDNAISGMVWEDLDYSDSLNSETQTSGVPVTLYYDVDGNGTADDSDILIGTQESGSGSLGADGDSTYAFTNLPDGNYVVVVDTADPDIPAGYSLPDSYTATTAIDLDSAGASGFGVNSIDNDWALIPALTLTKMSDPTSYLAGELVTFEIDLENHMAPVPPANCEHRGYAQRTISGSWTTPTNAQGAPDLAYAHHAASGNDDPLDFGGFDMGTPTPTDTINSIDVVIRNFYLSGQLDITGGNAKPDYIDIEAWDGSSFIDIVRLDYTTLHDYIGSGNQGDISISMPASIVSAWSWAVITSATQDIFRISYETLGNSDGITAYVDAVELVVSCPTTPATAGSASPSTIDPLPLTDTYDATKLQYVSASITPTSIAAGTISWDNVGPVHAGNRSTVTVTFLALTPPDAGVDGEPDPTTTTNSASSTGALFLNGDPTNDASDTQIIDIDPAGSIGDYVYWDADGSGDQSLNDPPIQGVLVELLDIGGNPITSVTTDAAGFYEFLALPDGDYTVRIAASNFVSGPLAGFSLTDDPDAGTANESDVTINNNDGDSTNDAYSDQDFGYDMANNVVSGTLWYDYDGDGVQDDNEPPIVGQSVNLIQGFTIMPTTTDANGFYSFSDVVDGSYTVSTTPPPNTVLTTASNPIAVDADSSGALDGTVFPDNDFGFQPSGSLTLGDTLYVDWDGNGTQGAGEEGIANVTVSLYADIDGDGSYDPAIDAIMVTEVTDASGTYSFGGLASGGDYLVLVDVNDPDFPSNLTQTDDPDTNLDSTGVATNLTSSDSSYDFGYRPLGSGSIGDTVFVDTDADGIHDSGEAGIASITVTLYEDSDGDGEITVADAVIASVETDSNGNYLFDSLAPGDYLVDVDGTDPQLPTETSVDMTTTLNYIPTSTDPRPVTLAVGETYLDADFGFAPGGAIGNFVWSDLDADGEFDDTEPPIVGTTINLYIDTDGNGVGDVLIDTTTTDANGLYLFDTYNDGGTNTGLPAGDYVVEIVKTATQLVTYDLDGNNDTTTAVALLPGQTFGAADFGVTDSSILVIGDTVWIDSNGDGVVDSDTETLLSGVKVELMASDGTTVVDTAYTDSFGNYAFGVADDGSTYSVVVDTSTLPFGGLANTTDRDNDNDSDSGQFTLSGSDVLDADFGYEFSGAFNISGTTFNDIDSSADWQNTSEPTYKDVTVYLWYSPDGGTTWINIDSQLTGQNGSYNFEGYPAGTYTVAASPGAAVLIGTSPTTPQNQQVVVVDRDLSDIDFGFVGTASIGDTVFYDEDGNGTQGGSEGGIPGLQVTLTYPNGQTVTTTTDVNGTYLFQGLGQGPYTITIDDSTLPSGTSNTADPDGDNNSTTLVNLSEGQSYVAGDFGYQTPGGASIGDTLWADLNGDGVFDPNGIDNIVGTADDEFGLEGVTVELYDADDPAHDEPGVEPPISTTTTDPDGLYGFPGLTLGNYIVFVADTDGVLAGYNASYDEDGGIASPDSTAPVSLAANDTQHDTADFGFSPTYASISGSVYDDDDTTNDNAINVSEDTPIAGVVVSLWSDPNGDGDPSDGVVLSTTITDSDGGYSFPNLLPDDYVVAESDPAGFSSDFDTGGANDNWIPVDLQGINSTGNDFLDDSGSLHEIGGSVYRDTGNDDILDGNGEAPIEGVTLTLYRDVDGDGDYTPNVDMVITTTLTKADGSYLFQNLPDADYLVIETDPPTATSDTDADGVGSNDANTVAVTLAGANEQGNDFLDSIVPSGYFYESSTGLILTGGSISVSGPGVATVIQDGSAGEYSWVIDPNFPGAYTLAITPPPGYIVDPNRPVAGTAFDPTGGPDPTVLGSDETGGTLDSFTAGSNPYYLTFDLAAGDPLVQLNNIPFVSKNTYDDWKTLYGLVLPGEVDPTDNPDGDSWNNALEYALCLHPKSGSSSHPGFCAEAQLDGSIDAVFYRVAGGATDVVYSLQGASQLGDPTSWTTLVADIDNPGGVTVAFNNQGDGSEEVRIDDLASIGTVTNQTGFVRLCVSLSSPSNTSYTHVFGWQETNIDTNQCETFSNPFLKKEAFSGKIDSVATGDADNKMEIFLNITSGAGIDFATLLDFTNKSYYIEITSGDFAGHRFDLTTGGLEKLEIATSFLPCLGPPYNTTATPGTLPATLAGDTFILREHFTIDGMFPPTAPFTAGANASVADRLLFYSDSWDIYYLDSVPDPDHWQLDGEAFSDYGGTVVPPSQGMFLHPRTTAVTMLSLGVVRGNDFVLPLNGDYTLVPSVYPIDQSATDRDWLTKYGTFDIDGGFDPANSDQFSIWDGDTDGTYVEGYSAYFHLQGAAGAGFPDGWRDSSDAFLSQQNDTALFRKDRSAFLLRRSSSCDATHTLPVPWLP